MPDLNKSLAESRALADAPTLGNLHPDARAQAIARAGREDLNAARLAWLHSPASTNVDGYEWGIFRVKWENGRAVEVWHTNGDFSDLDAARGVLVIGHACKLDGSICESRPDRCSDCPAGAGGKS